MATEDRLQLVGMPANHLELLDQVGRELGIIERGGGRLEVLYDDKGTVQGFVHFPLKKEAARQALIYCACIIHTAALAGVCVVCGREKRPDAEPATR